MPGDVGVDVLEHAADIVIALLRQDAELLRLFLRCADVGVGFLGQFVVPLVVPLAACDEVRLQAFYRIAERPQLGFVCRAVALRIVRCGMTLGAIGEDFDQRGALVRSGAI